MRGAPINFLRVFIAALSVLFAYQLGRVGARARIAGLPLTKAFTWFLRTFVTAFAIFWVGGFDAITIATLAAVGVSFGLGIRSEIRPKRDEGVHLDLR